MAQWPVDARYGAGVGAWLPTGGTLAPSLGPVEGAGTELVEGTGTELVVGTVGRGSSEVPDDGSGCCEAGELSGALSFVGVRLPEPPT